MCRIKTLFMDESGQDMIEYALLSSMIAVFLIGVLMLIGPAIWDVFQAIVDALT